MVQEVTLIIIGKLVWQALYAMANSFCHRLHKVQLILELDIVCSTPCYIPLMIRMSCFQRFKYDSKKDLYPLCNVWKRTGLRYLESWNHLNLRLLHFVAFFYVASQFSTGVDNEKVGVELDNRIFFSYFSLISIQKYHPKCNKTPCCIAGMITPNILV